MRQRLFKAISCVALMVSVFFCTSFIALADENEDLTFDNSLLIGEIDIEGVTEVHDFSPLAEIEDDDYIGGAVFQVLSQKAYVEFFHIGEVHTGYHNMLTVCSLPVYLSIGFQVERGHTYSGAVQLRGTTALESVPEFLKAFVFNGYSVSAPEDVDVSVYPIIVDSSGASADYTINLNFNNWQSTYDGYVYVNLLMDFSINDWFFGYQDGGGLPSPFASVSTHSSDWAGTLKDYATDAIIDSDGSLIKNQTIQQQQIADQQSQQSEQQHNSLINGYDNAANDSMLADKNSVLKGFEQQQDQAMSDGQQYVADFSANYDTAPLVAMAPAFMMISTWFNGLWGGMGNFSTVLIVGLMLCVAGYILKLKH